MNTIKNVLVIGGSGFIGEAVCNQLAKAGLRITVATRRYASAKHVLTNPTCYVVQADIHDRAALNRLVDGQDAVVNLLGVLHSQKGKPYGKQFRLNHVDFPKALCSAMTRQNVKRIVHISALGIGVEQVGADADLVEAGHGRLAHFLHRAQLGQALGEVLADLRVLGVDGGAQRHRQGGQQGGGPGASGKEGHGVLS